VCPQSGDAAAGLSALVYGVPAPRQVTVLPSPGCQVTETGVAVAVTFSPGTVAVFDFSRAWQAGLAPPDGARSRSRTWGLPFTERAGQQDGLLAGGRSLELGSRPPGPAVR